MEPLTEHRGVNGPVVYGFLRLVNVPAAREIALSASLAEYCRQHELLLSGVFTDRTPTDGLASAAFTGLLDVLVLPDGYGVVLPALSHLGPKAIAAERERQLEAAGARLLLVRGTPRPCTGRPPAFQPARRPVQAPEPGARSRPGRRDVRLTMPDPTQQFFAETPASVGAARHFALTTLSSWRLSARAEDIRLCVSELASNALAHGTDPGRGFLVKIEADDDFVRLEVHDSRGHRPAVRHPADMETSGRGLLLVEALSDGWGVEDRRPFGKIVWSRFKVGRTPC
ncbi:ATP-binding protein [Streptomyces sp. NPDC002926]